MAAPRAVWKGFLKIGAVSCAVKLINATSESDKVHFRILNRKDRMPVRSAYVDEGTGKIVETEDQIKGYELSSGDHLLIEQEDIKALKMSSEHTIDVEGFVDLDAIDQRYLDKPYYVIPADRGAQEPFAVVRQALADKKAAARSCVVLYQRGRNVLLQTHGKGMLLTTLRTHDEMVSEKSVFEDIEPVKLDSDLIDVASMLIDKKIGKFDPSKFEDRYEQALIELINAKKAGKKPPKPVKAPKENVVNLADVLRKSLEKEGIGRAGKPGAAKERKRA